MSTGWEKKGGKNILKKKKKHRVTKEWFVEHMAEAMSLHILFFSLFDIKSNKRFLF